MNRNQYVEGLANEILKAAAEELSESPLIKTASEEQINDALAEKIASVYDTAAAIYKQAEEVAVAADGQEADARAILEANGIDPDAVIAAAEEAAVEEMQHQEDDDEDEDEEDDDDEEEEDEE